jgi:hypothetical protein
MLNETGLKIKENALYFRFLSFSFLICMTDLAKTILARQGILNGELSSLVENFVFVLCIIDVYFFGAWKTLKKLLKELKQIPSEQAGN